MPTIGGIRKKLSEDLQGSPKGALAIRGLSELREQLYQSLKTLGDVRAAKILKGGSGESEFGGRYGAGGGVLDDQLKARLPGDERLSRGDGKSLVFDSLKEDRILGLGRLLNFQSTLAPADVEMVSGEQRVALYSESIRTNLSVGAADRVGRLGESKLLFSSIGAIDAKDAYGVLCVSISQSPIAHEL